MREVMGALSPDPPRTEGKKGVTSGVLKGRGGSPNQSGGQASGSMRPAPGNLRAADQRSRNTDPAR